MEDGATQLADWIARTGLSQRKAALKLGMHWTSLNKILLRKRLPGRQVAIDLSEKTGISVYAWTPTRVPTRRKADRRKGQKGQYWQGGHANVS